jgi:hypothetical protein
VLWFESVIDQSGIHHRLGEDAGKTEPARILAIFVLGAGGMPVSTLNK